MDDDTFIAFLLGNDPTKALWETVECLCDAGLVQCPLPPSLPLPCADDWRHGIRASDTIVIRTEPAIGIDELEYVA